MSKSKGYGQFCPLAMAMEILAERWTLLVVREILCGSTRFNEIQRGVPRMSSALLAKRLKELEHTGIITHQPAPGGGGALYRPTPAGQDLLPVLVGMGNWAQSWKRGGMIDDRNLDPKLLMWDIHRRIDISLIPDDRRFVIQFLFDGMPASQRLYWLMINNGGTEVCTKYPGFEIDLHVSCPLRVLTEIWLGHETMAAVLRREVMLLEGAAADIDLFKSALMLSVYAPAGSEPPGQPAPA